MAKRLTLFILIGMVLGIVAGYAMNQAIADPARLKAAADYFTIATDIFLHLIKMIIAPLVFSTLVVGIAHMGDTAALGRIGGRTLLWFVCASLLSLSLGLFLVNLFQPGAGLGLPLPPVSESAGLDTAAFNIHDFFVHLVPTSVIDAMAKNDILPIVIFSVFVGVALTAIGEKGAPLVRGIESLVHVMLQVTNYVMLAAPIAVFAAIAHAVAVNGLGILATYAKFVGSFYLGLALLWTLLIAIGGAFLGRRVAHLVRYIRDPILLAFSTASSEAAYPRLLEALDRFGVPRRIASFILPLGYSFNLDGSMMYMTFGTLFIAQAYGIEISIGQQILMVLMLMVTSKGMAGVPRASLVVIAAVMPHFGIPEAGLLLVLAVDQFLDMGRTGTNVVGNAVATAVIAKWEGLLEQPQSDVIEPLPAPAHTAHGGGRGLDLDSVPDPATVERAGVALACRHRPGAGPTIVFLPGYASDMAGTKALTLDAWAEANGRALLRFDYAGCGESGGRFEDGTLASWRDDALAVIEPLAPGPLLLVGSSMGGWIALLLAQVLGSRVTGLIGIAAAPDFTDWGFTAAEKATIARHGRLLRPSEYSDQPMLTTRAFWGSGQANLLLADEIAIDCPVRLLQGDADADVPWSTALAVKDRLRSADMQVILVKGGDHRLSRPADLDLLARTVAAMPETL